MQKERSGIYDKKREKKGKKEEEEESKTFGRDGPKAGMVPLTGQLYKFWMGCSFIIFIDHTPSLRGNTEVLSSDSLF